MSKPGRIVSIDWMRGLVMILMVLDHVSMAIDAGHFSSDSASTFTPGTQVDTFVFLTRWITHICAPTFVFLAGTALAISVERRIAAGQDPAGIDREIMIRGAFIAALDPTVISFFTWRVLFQVLYAIGASMVCMALLRRLHTRWLLVMALGWWAGGEWVTSLVWDPFTGEQSVAAGLLVAKYRAPGISISYPLIPWLSVMILGWIFGRRIATGTTGPGPRSIMFWCGCLLIGVFLLVKWANGYGNMWLYRHGDSLVQWLLVSKYPPSLAYLSLEIGLMCLLLALLMTLERHVEPARNGILLVFGQTAMFFYLVHRIVLEGAATWLGLRGCGDILDVYLITPAFLFILYFLCRWYRDFRAKHPGSWTRFI